MKGRLSTTVWSLIAVNAVALFAVIGLGYGAGARSGGLSLRDFTALPQVAGFEFLGAVFVAVVATVALIVVLGGKVLTPVAALVDFSNRLKAEEYSAQPENVDPNNDFGLIAGNCSHLSEKLTRAVETEAALQSLRQGLSDFQATLAQAARGELAARAQDRGNGLGTLPETFNSMADSLAKRLERLRATAGEVSAGAGQVITAATELQAAAGQQEQGITGASAAADQLLAASKQAAASADSAAEAARRTLEAAELSNRSLAEAAAGNERIRTALEGSLARIKSLVERSLEVYEVLNILNDTSLMAMNAAIEASRAGDISKGLDVLSAQLQKLGEHSRNSTRSVVTLLKTMQAEANEASAAMDQAKRVAEAGTQLSEQAGKSLAAVSATLKQAAGLVQGVSATARQQTQGADALLAALQLLAARHRQTVLKIRQAGASAEQAVKSAEQLTAATRPPSASPRPELVASSRS
jgi:twitching motility protein PilJ